MEKQTALEFAHEFINDTINNGHNFDKNKEINLVFDKNILENDPNLKTLKSEVSKIGFEIVENKENKSWILRKVR